MKMTTGRLILLSAVAGIFIGVTALYVMDSLSGNKAVTADVAQSAASCPVQDAIQAAIKPQIKGQVAAMLPAEAPVSLADLSFRSPDGSATTLADFSGKTVLLNLWATWCAPCREEMPALDRLQAELGGDDFEVVAVNIDRGDDTKPTTFLNDIGVEKLGYYRDETTEIFNEMRRRNLALGLPVTALIDEKGCVLAHMNGPAVWDGEDALALIKAAIPAKSAEQ